ncbi:MAG: hypothetical protein A2W91_07780 [Bacteroidetes bacterium GWF2_38_335]|nr:MAG: hypothetical protein A2W91_07780 [Bacteroidetes bacterium GWF2_38_335]OFY79047.1 MAG: hypothetical protein A2281_02940 [Bacteroidetes bacterium RIFOXYA12_FULL_38_20]HBS86128.1 prevent-host-death protein [Bacteroidales bacterium]
MKKIFYFLLIIISANIQSQELSQTIRGKISDKYSGMPLPGANIVILNSDPIKGTTSDMDGKFRLDKVPVGRVSIQITTLGYKTITFGDLILSSAKELVIDLEMEEKYTELNTVVVKAQKDKRESINKMTTLSARTFTVEETQRFAGGGDDPARLASGYAGVATGLQSNGIVIRGNAPKGLLWLIEGVEISNPNHFANLATLGGGGMTALSAQMMSNSGFLTGAFPAEYGNAISGVFDLKMRTGNDEKREHAFLIGSNGIDFSSEGPFIKGKKSSYLFNYRYSTLALIQPILPEEAGIIKYQDLSLKLNFPVKGAGVFSFWGLGATDNQIHKAKEDSLDWLIPSDNNENKYNLGFGASGVSHKIILSKNSNLATTLALSGNLMNVTEKEYDNGKLAPVQKLLNNAWNYTFNSVFNHRFSPTHNFRAGFSATDMCYDIDISSRQNPEEDFLTNYISEEGSAMLYRTYYQSTVNISDKICLNPGVSFMYFALNENYSVEPRLGIKWNFLPSHSLSFAYGKHSRLEPINYYLAEKAEAEIITKPNINLEFSKAHHFVLSYEKQIGEFTRIMVEPYFQLLFDIPVVENSWFSMLNLEIDWYFNESLVNEGTGRNMGIDLTYERFLQKGLYYLATISLFDSRYKGGDGIVRNTRFNKNYVVNFLAGKEWKTGKSENNLFSINGKISIYGGDRLHPVDEEATFLSQEMVYDYSRAFKDSEESAQILSFSINYRINKKKHSSFWSIHLINALQENEFEGYTFNKEKQRIEKNEDPFFIPYLSYKIMF